MTTAIDHFVARLALPEGGVDLRAELVTLQRARMRQALEKSGGDLARAARLLRMTRAELVRLESRLTDGESTSVARTPEAIDPSNVSRIAGGVERISAAVIRRLADEGLDEKAIAGRVGCNPFIVEKVLRDRTRREIERLDRDEKLTPKQIADRLRIPINRVRRVLVAHDIGALARRASGGQD